ncbi:MAG: hypothetical protein ABI846_10705 [Rudaea sp.]
MNPVSAAVRRRNRLMLVGIAALFFGPLIVAAALAWSGWRPAGTKAYGTLIDPPRDVSAVTVRLADGTAFVWRDVQWQWTLLALPGPTCAQKCRAALDDVLRMRATLGRNASRLRVLYLGAPLSDDVLAALKPLQQGSGDAAAFAGLHAQGDDSLALALVDPGGLLMMSYAAGYDVGGVRRDLPKVIN